MSTPSQRRRQRAKAIVHAEAERLGYACCADHGCVFGHRGGMGTNGGCQSDKLGRNEYHELRRRLRMMSAIAHALAERLAEGEP